MLARQDGADMTHVQQRRLTMLSSGSMVGPAMAPRRDNCPRVRPTNNQPSTHVRWESHQSRQVGAACATTMTAGHSPSSSTMLHHAEWQHHLSLTASTMAKELCIENGSEHTATAQPPGQRAGGAQRCRCCRQQPSPAPFCLNLAAVYCTLAYGAGNTKPDGPRRPHHLLRSAPESGQERRLRVEASTYDFTAAERARGGVACAHLGRQNPTADLASTCRRDSVPGPSLFSTLNAWF